VALLQSTGFAADQRQSRIAGLETIFSLTNREPVAEGVVAGSGRHAVDADFVTIRAGF
jgi:hypothetical protein